MRKAAKENISFAAGCARRQARRWEPLTGCVGDVSALILMESLATLWKCGRSVQTRTQRSITSGWWMRRRPSLQVLPLWLWQISRNLLGKVDCFLFKRELVFAGEVSHLYEYCANGGEWMPS